ncbi:hypothetical protein ACI789_17085 [Geodermatophilus sp. SYSU D00965]
MIGDAFDSDGTAHPFPSSAGNSFGVPGRMSAATTARLGRAPAH